MKRIDIILLVVLLLVSASEAMASKMDEATLRSQVEESRFFILKTNRKYIGASVEVYNLNGNMLISQKLVRRKIRIDFDKVLIGAYTIRIQKDNTIQEFRYVKK